MHPRTKSAFEGGAHHFWVPQLEHSAALCGTRECASLALVVTVIREVGRDTRTVLKRIDNHDYL